MKAKSIQVNDNNDSGNILDIKIAPVRDAEGKIISGFAIGDTLNQNKAIILMANPGDLKFNPDLGVSISDMLLSSEYLEYRHKIREHFAKDGLIVTAVDLYENKPFKIDADYGK